MNQQVLLLTQAIKDALDPSNSKYVDFGSAYDRVWRMKAYQKLQQMDVGGKMLSRLKNNIPYLTRTLTQQRFCEIWNISHIDIWKSNPQKRPPKRVGKGSG
ncbi:hypothetical protein CDAR_78181 [Caerostris darwini]|uniref:Uncharacterized protein n=1 Tax=Caerostris darwini TaxID=1538125 RepID=A0AAV4SCS4_9ARAC|nr:hypothetical protein CDAR_78181 [Caerostris darwini]